MPFESQYAIFYYWSIAT